MYISKIFFKTLFCFLGIRFFDPNLEDIQTFINSLNENVKELSEGQNVEPIEDSGLTFNLALVYDSAMIFTSAIKALNLEEGAKFTCDSDETWPLGSTIINYIRTVS